MSGRAPASSASETSSRLVRAEESRSSQSHAARQFVRREAGEVERGTLAGAGLLGGTTVYLNPAHTRPPAEREHVHFFFLAYCAGDQRAGDYCPVALHGEHAIDGQAEDGSGALRRHFGGHAHQLALEIVDAGAGERADRHDGRAAGIEKRAAQEVLDFEPHHVQGFAVHQVGLGEHGDAARDVEQAADLEVLAGLRLDGFVGGDHQQHQVDAAHASQHVAHEALVPGNIHEAQAQRLAAGSGKLKVGEADVDGDAAALFLRQAVGVDAGQRLDQRGFSVVDMPGGADDDGFHQDGDDTRAQCTAPMCENRGLTPMPSSPETAQAITPDLIQEHGLSAEEYQRILKWLGREPTLTELGIFSVMWSEHCSYKSSRVHLKRLPTHSRRVVQGPGENAGIIDIGDGWACAFKIESHNHPSFIEPFQGAATGVGGILRDIFTMGARPVAVMDSLRFGPITAGGGKPDPSHASTATIRSWTAW